LDQVTYQKINVVHHTVIEGISDNLILKNDPSTFLSREIEVRNANNGFLLSISLGGVVMQNLERTIGHSISSIYVDSTIWRGDLLLSGFKNDTYLSSIGFAAFSFENRVLVGYLTPLVLAWDGKLLPFSSFKPSADVLLTSPDSPIVFGKNPLFSDALFLNNCWTEYNFISSFAIYGSNQELL
ncbi:MAG: hypothetical protein L3J56_00005, partial [Bacteroidales bacterium]|nr:hypothetical protein [Bacteroidales bacterium]